MTPEELDRRLVDEAFEATRVPPKPDLAARVRERVRQERLRADGARGPLAWAMATGGAVVVLLVGLLVDSGYLDLPADQRPQAAPSSSTMAGPAAADVQPTILLPWSPGFAGLRRLDWSGRVIGSLSSPLDTSAASVSPDGSLAAVPDAEGPGATVLDAAGRPAAHLAAFGAWSGDGAHVACALVVTGAGARVTTSDLDAAGAPARRQAAVTGAGAPDGRWRLWGCSARADALVALRLEQHGPGAEAVAEVARIQLSSGRVLSRVDFAGLAAVGNPVLSHDARYLAENDERGRTAAIRDLVSGDVVGHVAGAVAAFSGDDQLVLVNGQAAGPVPAPRAALVDWRWGRTAWSASGGVEPLAVRPSGRDLVVSLSEGLDGATRTLLLAAAGRRVIDLDPAPAGRPLQG